MDVRKTAPKKRQKYSVTSLLSSNPQIAYQLELAQNAVNASRLEFRAEIAEIHRSFQKQQRPLLARRNDLTEKIPNFWRTAFRNHPIVGTIMTEVDKELFRYVRRVEVDSREDNVFNFKIRFHLDNNPFLENKMIMKDFHLTASAPFCRVTNLKFKHGILEEYKFLDKRASSRSAIGYKSFFAWLSDNRTPRRDKIAHYIRYDVQMNPVFYYRNKPTYIDGHVKKKCHHKHNFPMMPVKKSTKPRKRRSVWRKQFRRPVATNRNVKKSEESSKSESKER